MLPAYMLPCTATLIGKDNQGCCNLLSTNRTDYILRAPFRQVYSANLLRQIDAIAE
jgi:hypothetical protein